ncbi:MAG: YjjG family noncanonical pyrimidine nucleotidase [Flammeovirgaceae bacterium]
MPPYRHIFFDLDHTLWDFEKCSQETLTELYIEYDLKKVGIHHLPTFLEAFSRINRQLWALYDNNQISKEDVRKNRFPMIIKHLGISDTSFLHEIEVEYLKRCPQKPHLIPHSREVLNYLQEKGTYRLHILTNGFADIQRIKMKSSCIYHYFDNIITSELSGYKKPFRQMYEFALQLAKAEVHHSVMIGDNLETDMKGAIEIGMDCIFFNPDKIEHQSNVSHEIESLMELKNIL